MALDQNIGMVTAYAYAVSKGYTGTEEQFAQELASAGADLSQIQTQIDNFINTIVPAKTAEVTAEGTRQIGLVAAEGTAQKNAVTAEGTTQKNAVISEGTTQKNAVNSAGSTQVNAVNSAGSTQVGNVNTAGSTQVGAVQAKGQEVINSIPSDYTALSDDVDDLKSAFEEYEDGEYQYLKGTFQQGGLNSGNLQPSQKYRVSETDIISYDRDITLIIGSGYRIGVHIFVNGVFSSDSGWQTGSYRIPANTTFKLVIAKTSEDTSSTADIVIFKSAIKFQSVININTESIRSISEVSTKNLSLRSEAVTTSTGYLNGSTGTFGTVESGKTYTFSAFNESDKTYGVKIRINDGGWEQQAVFNPLANARFSVTFTATVDGDISLSAAYGSYYDPLFSQIQLEEGSTATGYVPYHDTSAVDKVARKAINDFYKFNSEVHSVAHQGGNVFGYPQNTLPNFIACAKNGWKEVEFDVQWASDNVPVISHDDTKTIYGTSTTVSIASTTYSDLQNMQFFADATIKIPSLYDALDTCKLYGLIPHVELKTSATEAQITTIINYLKRKKLFANAFITSFQLGNLITAISIDNNTNTSLSVTSTASIDDLIAGDSRFTTLLNHAGKTTFAFSYTLLAGITDVKTHLAEFSDKGAYICVYTLDTDALINTYASMCDYITSNALRVEEVIA